MKKRHIISIALILAASSYTRAQESDTLMKLVLEQNRSLKVARETFRTAILRAGTGNTPADPEVEFGYLFGEPANLGNKINIVVKQQLDFPTSYAHRSKLKKIRSSRAELEYLLVRQEILSETHRLWIEQLHLNQLSLLLNERLGRAKTIRDHVQAMMEVGEVGPMEYSQANLMLASVEGEYEEVQSEQENNHLALLEMTGGTGVEIGDTLFPKPVSILEDSLLAAYRTGPGALLHQRGREEKESEKNLARSQHLPKLSAGYFSEVVPTEAFRGFTVGISVPLWENTRTVKTAQSALIQSEAELDQYLYAQEKELRQKINALENLHSRVEKLEEALGSANSLNLLASSMESGEISLSEYFYTSDFYFRNQQLLLRYKRDLLALEADLLKIYL
ncbi:MAG: TolC family protein [Bacteroidetes bacterium]|nr:TolC family protein [Bacteroidota bacterium]